MPTFDDDVTGSAEFAFNQGVQLDGRGDLAGAAAAYQRAIATGHPEWAPKAQLALGILRLVRDAPDSAEARLAQQIDSGPDEAVAAVVVAGVFAERGDVGAAAAAYQIAIDSGQVLLMAMAAFGLGQLGQGRRDFTGAIAAYQIAVDSGESDYAPKAALNIGILRAAQRDAIGAAQALQVAIDSGHTDWAPRAALVLGMLREAQKDAAGAAAAYQIAVDSGHPEEAPQAAAKLGQLLAAELKIGTAAAAYQVAVDSGHAETMSAAALGLGTMRLLQDDLDAAAAAFRIAIDGGDTEDAPRAAFGLALVRENQGDVTAAAAAYQIAIDSDHPELAPWARDELDRLRTSGPLVRDPEVYVVVAQISNLFSGDHFDSSVRDVVTHIRDSLVASQTLRRLAQNTSLSQFSASPDLHDQFESAVIDAMDCSADLSIQILSDTELSEKLLGLLVPIIYEKLK